MGRFATLQWLISYSPAFLVEKETFFFCEYVCLPVVTRADLIAAGDQFGCFCLRSATIPDTTGVAIDVPDMNPYPPLNGKAASIPEPGAAISGFT